MSANPTVRNPILRLDNWRNGFRRRILRADTHTIPEHVRDQSGVWQDLIIMRCPLEKLWRDLEDQAANGDWQRAR